MPTLNWIGRKAVENHHHDVPFHLLRADPARSFGDASSGNLLVQGDNLLALKALLPVYAGQVKCIYIDPPYNTGNEHWVYNDAVNSPEMRDWLGKVVGGEAEDLSRHDKWLCMMYPRLALLKQFLRDDGLIFVSVDENEHRYLELLMDEIFGATNRIETIVWKKSYGGGAKSKHIVNLHEYISCFARNIEKIGAMSLPPDGAALRYYKFEDEKLNTRGPYRLQPLATTSMDSRPNLRYPIAYEGEEIWPDKQWQWSKERVTAAMTNNELVISKRSGKWSVSYKQYLKDETGEERGRKPYSIVEGIYTQQGTNEIKEIFGDGKAFSFPKPTNLIKQLVQIASGDDDIVLDSFGGSGTTGHAVLAANREDNGNRRFILIEMEPRIARDITAERLKRVIAGAGDAPGLGGGFQFAELGPTLFDAHGRIRAEVSFDELARHVFFVETGAPLPEPEKRSERSQRSDRYKSPLLGVRNDTAVYLLYNGVLKDKSPDGGNALTRGVLEGLPPHDGPKVIYGTSCRVGPEWLRQANAAFKQIPYAIKVT